MTGVLQWMAITSSDGIGKEGAAVGWLSMLESVLIFVELNAGNCQVLMGKDQGKVDEADILESVIDHPTSMKRLVKHSTSNWQKSNCL